MINVFIGYDEGEKVSYHILSESIRRLSSEPVSIIPLDLNTIRNHFKRDKEVGIVGVAGTRYMAESGRWWEDFSKMHGAVYHEKDGNRWLTRYSKDMGMNLMPVVLVDGLFFGVSKSKLVKGFDESIKGFHFYDVDFCFSNYFDL